MADHIGRLPVLVLANVLALLGNVATSFTYGLTDFAASRLLAGLATDNNFFMMYIIGETIDWVGAADRPSHHTVHRLLTGWGWRTDRHTTPCTDY
jgi:predicted MFS family arabinose efflux permease